MAVLTALSLEYREVRSHLTNVRSVEHPRFGTRALVGRLPDTPWSVALLELGEGSLTAAALTERVLSWLTPEAVLFVGVAGSLKRDIGIGDVVVATKVYGIHGGKETPQGFQVRPEAWHTSHRLMEAARAALRDDPHAHLKPIATGDVLLAATRSALAEHLRKNYADAAAIEMEGSGVVAATHHAGGQALVIRGISDRANAAKSRADAEGSQLRAAEKAAAAAVAVLREFRPRRRQSESADKSTDSEEGPIGGTVTAGATSPLGEAPFTGHSSRSRSAANSTAKGAGSRVSGAGPESAGEPRTTAALPAVPAAFTGRDDDLARLLPVLDPHTESDPPVGICLISGLGGIGKTSLALYAGHKAVGEGWFPGGTLFIDFRGYDVDPLTTEQALLALLEGLGVQGVDVPRTTPHRYTRYQQLLASRRPMLLLFDNVSPQTRLTRLLPGTRHHRVLITSRYRLTDLDARLISLDSLQPIDAVRLVEKSLRISDEDDDRSTREEADVARLVALCDRHPLALQIAVQMLRKDRNRAISSLANELQVTAERTRTLGLQPILDTAYSQLFPDLSRLFRLMSLAPRAEVSTDVAVVLADRTADRAAGLLAELASFHLVTSVSTNRIGRWRLHDMVRQYGAKKMADSVSLREEGEAARERVLEFYRQRALDAQAVLRKAPGRTGQTHFTNRADALAWLDAEWPSLMASVQWCREQQHAHGAVRLTLALMDHGLSGRRSFDDWMTVVRHVCEAADHLGDPAVSARLWNSLGFALQQTGQRYAAMDAHTRALKLYRAGSNRQGEAKALYNIGLALLDLGQVEEAIETLTRARRLHEAAGNPQGEATTLHGLGGAERKARRLGKAIEAYSQASELYRTADDLPGQAGALSSLGSVLQESMREREALKAYGTAAQLYRELDDWHRAGLLSQWIARIHDAAGNRQEARDHYLEAAEAFALAEDHDRATECRIFADALT